jgi:phosphotransferase system enzyme I (PtsI)
MVRYFLRHFDFLSIGTNDLIQYTLAIDRTDEAVAHLYDPMHPAVLRLVADVIAAGREQGKSVSVCGETAGDVTMTRLLLGLGLRSFSMYPSQILPVKQEVLRADTRKLAGWGAGSDRGRRTGSIGAVCTPFAIKIIAIGALLTSAGG